MRKKTWQSKFLAVFAAMLLVFSLSGCDGAGSIDSNVFDALGSLKDGVVDGYLKPDGNNNPDNSGDVGFIPQDYNIMLPDDTFVEPWNGSDPYIEINNNKPFFSAEDKTRTDAFENYSELDSLGRCGVAYANICQELMPTEARGEIGSVKPSGWHTIRYNGLVSGNYLYNRCHLIGFQLAGENANKLNLITGTRYLNIDGMLDFENAIDDYVEDTGNHVLYRVMPVFHADNLVCDGLLMEAYSVEDKGAGIEFCVFAYNVQPGVIIDYATGDSWRADGQDQEVIESGDTGEQHDFVLNTSSGKFHVPDCEYAESMSESNRLEITQTVKAMFDAGYSACGRCHPDELD